MRRVRSAFWIVSLALLLFSLSACTLFGKASSAETKQDQPAEEIVLDSMDKTEKESPSATEATEASALPDIDVLSEQPDTATVTDTNVGGGGTPTSGTVAQAEPPSNESSANGEQEAAPIPEGDGNDGVAITEDGDILLPDVL